MGFTGRQIIAEVLFVRTRCLLDCRKMNIDKKKIADKKVEGWESNLSNCAIVKRVTPPIFVKKVAT